VDEWFLDGASHPLSCFYHSLVFGVLFFVPFFIFPPSVLYWVVFGSVVSFFLFGTWMSFDVFSDVYVSLCVLFLMSSFIPDCVLQLTRSDGGNGSRNGFSLIWSVSLFMTFYYFWTVYFYERFISVRTFYWFVKVYCFVNVYCV
jgi:hypothetical protein